MDQKKVVARPKQSVGQTMREKSEKTVTKAGKPKRVKGVLRTFAAPFKYAGKILGIIGSFKPIHFIGLILFPKYFRNSWKELRLVTWPNRKQTRQLTLAVVIFATIFGVLIAITDYGLDKVFRKVILKQ